MGRGSPTCEWRNRTGSLRRRHRVGQGGKTGHQSGIAEDVQELGDGDGGEVTEATEGGVRGETREGAPGGGFGVEEVVRGDGGVLREDAEEVGLGFRVRARLAEVDQGL
ncbi:hypothetical protein MLD38_031851 [Melastoma candidum]|uniref:Uncharacterized protein n=1 Tax=Melastoma candidum TaxID=119954 RepID=A0ACB9MQB7_9MYRT|nr:hypothetical protein MLD38_031851 [Melastoma candidum]